jgi:hypothetical protein
MHPAPFDPLPCPVHHSPEPDLRPVAKARGQQVLHCCDCDRQVICERSALWARCWFCAQPKERKAP